MKKLALRENFTRSTSHRSRHRTILIACFAAVVASFGLSTAYANGLLRDLDASLEEISESVLPKLARLAVLRSEMGRVEQMLSEAAEGRPWGQGALKQEMSAIDAESAMFFGDSRQGRDASLQEEASRRIERLRRATRATRDRILRSDYAGAEILLRDELRPALERADDSVRQLIEMSTREANTAVHRAEGTRKHAAAVALALDAGTALLSILLGIVALRGMDRAETLVENRVAELEMFASRVSHDIRGPLMPALFALREAGTLAVGDRDIQLTMERGTRSLRLVESIVNDLLAFARSGATPEANARASVQQATDGVTAEVSSAAMASGANLSIAPFEDQIVACPPGVLASIVSNLVRNAVKYAAGQSKKEIRVAVREKGCHVRVEVADTGPGLSPGLEDVVFEPYVRGGGDGPSGLGLGLATVKRLTEAYQGSVGVVSHTGKGCTFWFELPKAPRGRSSMATPPRA